MMVLFAIFILGCGITHVMDVIVIWEPIYRLDAFFRIITAVASIGTAIVLVKVTPDILKIPTSDEWIKLNKALKEKQGELENVIEKLNVKQKELEDSNYLLQRHKDDLQATNEELITNQEELQTSNEELISNKQELENMYNELREAEKSLIVLNNELEERVKARTLELEERNEELVKINNDLDNFIYTASHDLKTPVVNLEGLISVLKLQLSSNTDQMIQKLVKMCEESINKMQETLKGLSEIVKAQKNIENDIDDVEEIEETSFQKILENVKVDLRENIIESNAVIEEDIKVDRINLSKNNLRSIIHNLLTNAIKYRSSERLLKIKISTLIEGGYSVITVEDNGLGISEKYHAKLFTMFRRLHTHVEGTGIGLYIVKRIVENNKGKVILESQVDVGSTFKIYIPINNGKNKYNN